MAHLEPLPADTHGHLAASFATFERILGFVPNSLLTMQRCPEIVEGFGALTRSIMHDDAGVDLGFLRLAAHLSSRAAGCRYCEAHSLVAAQIHGVSKEKVDAIWDYKTSPLYSEAERAALDFAAASGAVPNAVDNEIMANLKAHWSENQIVRILAAVSLYGFLNRWNDSMATTLETAPKELADRALTPRGWDEGKHG
ncbi:MAG: carboxymuconolactone decarboxylase family protein [bacterium]|nr:carboxymuconolactone decarboxylase family protein [bacterium]